jgi:hypothetical protein
MNEGDFIDIEGLENILGEPADDSLLSEIRRIRGFYRAKFEFSGPAQPVERELKRIAGAAKTAQAPLNILFDLINDASHQARHSFEKNLRPSYQNELAQALDTILAMRNSKYTFQKTRGGQREYWERASCIRDLAKSYKQATGKSASEGMTTLKDERGGDGAGPFFEFTNCAVGDLPGFEEMESSAMISAIRRALDVK